MGPEERFSILVVDDTEANIDILVETLGSDHDVRVALNGAAALDAVSHDPPDLILLDIVMPEMDGYQVCEILKNQPDTRDIPVIFITALSDARDEKKGLGLGAVDYITKPFSTELVRARVANHLELKRHRDTLARLVAQRTRELNLAREATIHSLAGLAETRDPETGGHILRTQRYVRALARVLAKSPVYADILTDEVIDLLFKSAPLHDIGKVGVADSILLKPDRLTDNEFEAMKLHTNYGRDALRFARERLGQNSFMDYAREIAYTHHERWDGSGYPLGLAGEEIPLSGRLMALADVYDALISQRVYKQPMGHINAVSIIASGRGTHFDPDIVDAFMEIKEDFRSIALTYPDTEAEPGLCR
ncbi:MAG TPA: two-component system response regulator [Desulfobacteraceae bacterium]|nr:two-component system response regulator [Desulfobacteraceae bacterium]